MRSGGNNFNYFTENQLTRFSAVCEMFSLEFGHTLSVRLLVRPWPYRQRWPCNVYAFRTLLNFKVIGQRSRSHEFCAVVCMILQLHAEALTCTLTTSRSLLNINVIGQGHMWFLLFFLSA